MGKARNISINLIGDVLGKNLSLSLKEIMIV